MQVYWKPSLPEGSPEVAVGSPRSSEGLKSPNGNSSHKSFVGAVTSVQSLNLFARLPLGRFAADSILSVRSPAYLHVCVSSASLGGAHAAWCECGLAYLHVCASSASPCACGAGAFKAFGGNAEFKAPRRSVPSAALRCAALSARAP